MPHPHLAVETSPAGYRWLRLARPERRNALDVSLLRAVTEALAAEPGVPVVMTRTASRPRSRPTWPGAVPAPGPGQGLRR